MHGPPNHSSTPILYPHPPPTHPSPTHTPTRPHPAPPARPGGARRVWRRVEGVPDRAVRRAALPPRAVAGAGAVPLQARAHLHPGRGGCGTGPQPHAGVFGVYGVVCAFWGGRSGIAAPLAAAQRRPVPQQGTPPMRAPPTPNQPAHAPPEQPSHPPLCFAPPPPRPCARFAPPPTHAPRTSAP